jgi:4-aminobutyrate aminotransferase-like enzyme
VDAERLQEHAREVGDGLIAQLRMRIGDHPLVGDIRGSGLFLGVELVTDRQTLEPATGTAADVVNGMRDRGVLIGTEGAFANVLKIRPPMPFTAADAALLCDTLAGALP